MERFISRYPLSLLSAILVAAVFVVWGMNEQAGKEMIASINGSE